MKRENKAIAVSAILHALVIAVAIVHVGRTEHKKEQKSQPVEIVQVKKRQPKNKIVEATPMGPMPCKDFYGGIGIRVRYIGYDLEQIDDVVPGYPADKAGVRPGDVIDINLTGEIKGEVGTEVTVYLYRSGEHFPVKMIRARICLEN